MESTLYLESTDLCNVASFYKHRQCYLIRSYVNNVIYVFVFSRSPVYVLVMSLYLFQSFNLLKQFIVVLVTVIVFISFFASQ